MKHRVFFITGVFLPEPIVSAGLMADLAEKMSEHFQVTVIRPHPSRPFGFSMPEFDTSRLSYNVVELDSYICPQSKLFGRFRESISYGRACIRYLKPIKKEILFIYNAPWHLFGRSMVALFCKRNHILNITPVQDIYPESLLSKLPRIPLLKRITEVLLMPFDMCTLHNATMIHTISDGMRDYLMKHRNLDISRFVVVRNWQDERPFVQYRAQNQVNSDHPFTFMFLGNVGALAGLDVVIDAFVKSQIKNSRLVIAGSGSARESLKIKSATHLECDIQFWDVPFGEVPATQAKADVMLLPVKKGFASSSIPSKLPAYMFSAKPILASIDDNSDSARCILDAGAGWVCEPEDASSLAAAMVKCTLENEVELKSMGEAGFTYAIENFSRTNNLQKLYNACVEVIENHYR